MRPDLDEVLRAMIEDAQRVGWGYYSLAGMTPPTAEPNPLSAATDRLVIKFMTLTPASLYVNTPREVGATIRFDRTPKGEIMLPGRWWQEMVARGTRCSWISPEVLRQAAAELATADPVIALVPAGSNRFDRVEPWEPLRYAEPLSLQSVLEALRDWRPPEGAGGPYNSAETSEIMAPDLEGRLVMQEVLWPNTEAYAPLPP